MESGEKMRVLEVNVAHPINAIGGLYVEVEGSREEIYGGEANKLAMQTAYDKGWNGNGKASMGIPVKQGILLYTRSYWFHEKR
jgi:trehalose utilization protein